MAHAAAYTAILNELNRDISRAQPKDIIQFCANFFNRKLESERAERMANPFPAAETKTSPSLVARSPTHQASSLSGSPPASGSSLFRGHQTQEAVPAHYNLLRRTSVSAESMVPTAEDYVRISIPKTQSQMARISQSISNNLLFKNLDEDQHRDVLDAMAEKRIQAKNEVVIRQGDVGDYFYIVETGEFDVYVKGPRDEVGKKVASIVSGGSFGELALMYNAPRAATVICSSEGGAILWALDRITFRRILMENTSRKRRMYEHFLSTVPILSSLEGYERQKIADALDTVVYAEGNTVIRQGDIGEQFFIIEFGEANVVKEGEGTVARLGKGDYFGELALLNDAPRAATVVAITRLKVATLGKRAFNRLLGPVVEIMKRKERQMRGPQAGNEGDISPRAGVSNGPMALQSIA
ncbi:cAMP-dependent protein kinase regulatory subunit [Neolecta irregularis DAH-3]|uniref:cAMP-dependent protein kinase regulatory subunit n=1 Tax=Neolecta irregularis (strain DAH-3) TaxID=1198029 RepID=A0A1U7LRQ4_NEOID|nr:cAMP-dependent protein kinase regulatory subunit [Neolecta irregularis DAH-3]|eukprot:OLL25263.1 cAMP-dependent protein kinase regulatory subunit [Neolecta irregularis DAH-3]